MAALPADLRGGRHGAGAAVRQHRAGREALRGAHWVWDYSLGFVRRGLLGAAAEAAFGPEANSAAFIERASVAMCALAYLAYALFAALVVAAKPSLVALAAALSGALVASALPVFAHDLGRPDQLNFVLLLLACLAVLRLPMAAALLAALLAAGSPAVDPAAWRGHWEAQAPFLVGHSPDDAGDALAVHHRGTAENIRLTRQEFRKKTAAVTAFTLACVAVLAAAVRFRALRADWLRRHRLLRLLAFLCLFSPAAVFLIGFDYMRWNHGILTNAVLAVLCLAGMGAAAPAVLRAPGRTAANGAPAAVRRDGGGFVAQLAASVAFVVLLFPQFSGVVEGRDFPEPFARLVQRALRDPSRVPRHCLDPHAMRNQDGG